MTVTRKEYRPLSDAEKKAMQAIKDAGEAYIDVLGKFCQPDRETSLAVTNAEQSVMWAVKGVTG